MSTEIMNNTSTGILSNLSTISLADFQNESYTSSGNRLSNAARNAGRTDTVLHVGNQIQTGDVIGHVLTIVHVGYATAPAKDNNGNPIFDTDVDGVAVQKMSRFPVCHFKEAPGWWYNGGKMLDGIIEAWKEEMEEEEGNDNLPRINAELEACGGVQAYFAWKDKRDNSGQRYVNIILG